MAAATWLSGRIVYMIAVIRALGTAKCEPSVSVPSCEGLPTGAQPAVPLTPDAPSVGISHGSFPPWDPLQTAAGSPTNVDKLWALEYTVPKPGLRHLRPSRVRSDFAPSSKAEADKVSHRRDRPGCRCGRRIRKAMTTLPEQGVFV